MSDGSSRARALCVTPLLSSIRAVVVIGLSAAGACGAADDGTQNTADASNGWFARSDRAKESQPHWMTPVVTVTPRLEQEYRYDQLWRNRPNGVNEVNYGFNKGLELIPTEHTEVIISVPGYVVENGPHEEKSGWADETLLLKYRLLSANEENGNYIVTGFLGVALPTGSPAFTTGHTVWTPTLAGGKGWGTRESGFDIQSTLGISWPDSDRQRIGVPVIWNTALQAHVLDKLWPEIEVNYTHWVEGPNAGKSQTLITPGLVVGRYDLIGRVRFVIGVGYQQAVSSFRMTENNWILTVRAPF